MITKVLENVGSTIIGAVLDDKIKSFNTMNRAELEISEWNNLYNSANKLLFKLNSELFEKNRIPDSNNNIYELRDNCVYTLKLKSGNIKVVTYRKETKSYYSPQYLKLTFQGKDKYKLRSKFVRKIKQMKESDKIEIGFLGGEINVTHEVPTRTWNSIVMDNQQKNRIVNGLQRWDKDKDWYQSHELVHKIGVLLYGEAGTGKSTIIRAISSMFKNAPIFTINTKTPMESISGIIKKRKCTDGVMIVLLEDFDMYFQNRVDIPDNQVMNMDIQNAIFQLLDGVYSTDDTIYIATTNHIDKLDNALIRSGRFDIKEELKFLNKQECIKVLNNFGYDESTLDELELNYPCQPSKLQSLIMEHRAKETKWK